MSSRISSEAPDFVAQKTAGEIRFHDWIGDGWAILFSHSNALEVAEALDLDRSATEIAK